MTAKTSPTDLFRRLALGLCGLALSACAPSLLDTLQAHRLVDLSHPLAVDIPHWPGFPPATRTTLYDYPQAGFKAEQYCHVGQWGTHIDPPGHFFAQLRMLDAIPAGEMLMPLVVIDVHRQVAVNPDYTVTLADIIDWERRHGPVPAGSFVALRTDWSKRWPDQAKMLNADAKGVKHYPGWSLEPLKYLYETRKITASGHETTDTDPGLSTSKDDYSLESYVLGTNHYQVELLAHLDAVPEAGAVALVVWPNVARGTGFSVRVLALVNPEP